MTCRVLTIPVLVLALAAAAAPGAQQPDRPTLLLEAADQKATVEGDLAGAIRDYEAIVTSHGKTHRPVAAQALLRAAEAYRKLGDAQAPKVYARVLAEFADQTAAVVEARAQMGAGAQVAPDEARQTFCSRCGADLPDGSISRDGRWMAATDWDSGDIVLHEISTGQRRRLYAKTNSFTDWSPPQPPIAGADLYAFGPLWSPDGQSVAYTWSVSGGSPRVREVPTELRVIARTGGVSKTLVRNPEFEWLRVAAWSRDGRQILAVLRKPDKTWQLGWVSVADGRVTIVKSLDWRLGRDQRASLSPDGRFIAYSALSTNPKAPPAEPESAERHVYVLAADGSSEVEATKTTGIDDSPMWTPDGSALVFRSDRTGTEDLWVLPMRGGTPAGAPSVVLRDVGYPFAVLDSGVLLSIEGAPQFSQVIVAHLDSVGSLPARPELRDTFIGSRPSWSPDGNTLQFARGGGGLGFDIVLHAVNTGVEQRIPRHGARRPVEWLHDGSGFLTVAGPIGSRSGLNTTGSPEITAFHTVDPQRGTSREVLRTGTRSGVAALSPDDKTLYQFGRDPAQPDVFNRLVAVDVGTGRERSILSLPMASGPLPAGNGGVALALAPDGRSLAFQICSGAGVGSSPSGTGQVVTSGGDCWLGRVNVDGTEYRRVFGPFRGIMAADRLAWTGDGRSLLFAAREGAAGECGMSSCLFRLMRVSADGGLPEFTGLEMDLGVNGTFAVSADGTRVAFDKTVPATSDVVAFDLSRLLKQR